MASSVVVHAQAPVACEAAHVGGVQLVAVVLAVVVRESVPATARDHTPAMGQSDLQASPAT